MKLLARQLSDDDPEENLRVEEGFFAHVHDIPFVLFYRHRPCVIMGRNNRVEQWVNQEAVRAAGIPLLRRITGGGTVYHDLDTFNYSFIFPRGLYESLRPPGEHIMDLFRRIVIESLAPAGLVLEPTRKSDLSLNGRKVSGNAARITSGEVLFHGTLLMRVDYEALERFLPIPPDREGGESHRAFVTSLEQEGFPHSAEELAALIATGVESALAADT
jgi:lipoate-protein ligase A